MSVRHSVHHQCHHPLLLVSSTPSSKLIFSPEPFFHSFYLFTHQTDSSCFSFSSGMSVLTLVQYARLSWPLAGFTTFLFQCLSIALQQGQCSLFLKHNDEWVILPLQPLYTPYQFSCLRLCAGGSKNNSDRSSSRHSGSSSGSGSRSCSSSNSSSRHILLLCECNKCCNICCINLTLTLMTAVTSMTVTTTINSTAVTSW